MDFSIRLSEGSNVKLKDAVVFDYPCQELLSKLSAEERKTFHLNLISKHNEFIGWNFSVSTGEPSKIGMYW